jgi:soluble lytic murein transglycosylase-like protein
LNKSKFFLLSSFFTVSFILSYNILKLAAVKQKSQVLGFQTQILNIYPTLTPTLTPTPTAKPIPTSTPVPSLTPTTAPQTVFSSEQINSFIDGFSGQYAVDSNVVRHIATCESGFNPASVNGAYAGLFQFSKMTWMVNRKLMGENDSEILRLNAEEAVQTAAYLLSIGKGYLWPNCLP